MGCECSKIGVTNKVSPISESNDGVTLKQPTSTITENSWTRSDEHLIERIHSGCSNKSAASSGLSINSNDTNESIVDETLNALPVSVNNQVDIVDADLGAFNSVFVKNRQEAIDNRIYRTNIESWQPNSLEQLSEAIQILSNAKSAVECHWMIFYWIACNIEYDVISYFNDEIPAQSAEEVFRTKKGVCAGYSRLYQYLCNQLGMTCEEISGYSKGYGYDQREEQGVSLEKDHAWNAVQISDHWYLIDSTWGTGTLTKTKIFKRELNCYYFLAPPHQMIYHHLPEDPKWQLLRTPIDTTQYIQIPKIRPEYFQLKLELISPAHQAHVELVPKKSYALVLVRTPRDVDLTGCLKLNENEIEGGHQIVYDVERQFYRCYFAPASIGRHKIELFAKKIDSMTESYDQVLDLTLNTKKVPEHPISFPKTWKTFYDLGLKLILPINTHSIKVSNGITHARVIIRAPMNVVLMGTLENIDGKEVEGGAQVYCDRRTSLWKCKFAPDRDGLFEANILGKKQTDLGSYSSVIRFKVEASQMPLPPLAYPQTWQLFHDLNLKVKAPRNCARVPWPEHASYVEVIIRAPNDIQLSCDIRYNDVIIENGSLAQFDSNKQLWRLLFAPQRVGEHDLFIFAKRNSEEKPESAIKFYLNVTKLHRAMKFPTTYGKFQDRRCQIYEPLDGVLKRGATIPIHCVIPDAADVKLKVDSNWLQTDGYQPPILRQNITVGSQTVSVFAKYGQGSNYDGLVRYTVQ